jgi:hypothetical protein
MTATFQLAESSDVIGLVGTERVARHARLKRNWNVTSSRVAIVINLDRVGHVVVELVEVRRRMASRAE